MEESAFIQAIATESEQPVEVVEEVLEGFRMALYEALDRHRSFELSGLGTFTLSSVGSTVDTRISFEADIWLRDDLSRSHYERGLTR